MNHSNRQTKSPPSSQDAVALYLDGLSPRSRKRQECALRVLETMVPGPRSTDGLDWSRVTLNQAAALRSAMAERYAPTTANAHKSAFDGVITACRRLGLITSDHEENLRAVMKPFQGSRKPLRQYVTPEEMRAMFTACERTSRIGSRDAAMMALMYAGAMRSFEARSARVEHINWQTKTVRVLGKGNRERHVQMTGETMQILSAWLGGRTEGVILCAVSKHGTPMRLDKPLSWDALTLRLTALYTRAKLTRLTSHDLRRACLTQLIELADVHVAQEHAGHANPNTTRWYDMTAVQRKHKTLDSISFFKGETQ